MPLATYAATAACVYSSFGQPLIRCGSSPSSSSMVSSRSRVPEPRWRLMNRMSGRVSAAIESMRFGVARPHEDALLPVHQEDQALAVGAQPAAILGYRARSALALGDVKASDVASAAGQRRQGIGGRQVLQIEADACVPAQQLGELGDRVAVAGMDTQGGAVLGQHPAELEIELGCDVLQLGQQAGTGARLRPHQLLPQRREPGTAALLQHDQLGAEERRPARKDVPGVPVRHPSALGRSGQLSGLVHRSQQVEQAVVNLFARLRC